MIVNTHKLRGKCVFIYALQTELLEWRKTMAFCLKDLLEFDDIVIQCHDNPDADALASGFALKWYLKKHGKEARFIYGGRSPISKSNLVLMK